jgi:hypothetical protein
VVGKSFHHAADPSTLLKPHITLLAEVLTVIRVALISPTIWATLFPDMSYASSVNEPL